jgi:hypothetical protein
MRIFSKAAEKVAEAAHNAMSGLKQLKNDAMHGVESAVLDQNGTPYHVYTMHQIAKYGGEATPEVATLAVRLAQTGLFVKQLTRRDADGDVLLGGVEHVHTREAHELADLAKLIDSLAMSYAKTAFEENVKVDVFKSVLAEHAASTGFDNVLIGGEEVANGQVAPRQINAAIEHAHKFDTEVHERGFLKKMQAEANAMVEQFLSSAYHQHPKEAVTQAIVLTCASRAASYLDLYKEYNVSYSDILSSVHKQAAEAVLNLEEQPEEGSIEEGIQSLQRKAAPLTKESAEAAYNMTAGVVRLRSSIESEVRGQLRRQIMKGVDLDSHLYRDDYYFDDENPHFVTHIQAAEVA